MYYDALFSVDYRAVEDDVGLEYNSFQTDDFKPQGKIVHTVHVYWVLNCYHYTSHCCPGSHWVTQKFIHLSVCPSFSHNFHMFTSKELKLEISYMHSSCDKALFKHVVLWPNSLNWCKLDSFVIDNYHGLLKFVV